MAPGALAQVLGDLPNVHNDNLLVGFDTSDFTLTMIKEGIIFATMQQDPKRMGREGLKIAVEAVKGEYKGQKGAVIDLGVNVITRDKI